jgi:hypothetical protein
MGKKLTVKTENKLEAHVKSWINKMAPDYGSGAEGVLNDLFQGGCASGMVGHLIYYSDTLPFFKKYKAEILALAKEQASDFGTSVGAMFEGFRDWDKDDPLCEDTQNQNLLAWYGFVETAHNLANRAGIDI